MDLLPCLELSYQNSRDELFRVSPVPPGVAICVCFIDIPISIRLYRVKILEGTGIKEGILFYGSCEFPANPGVSCLVLLHKRISILAPHTVTHLVDSWHGSEANYGD